MYYPKVRTQDILLPDRIFDYHNVLTQDILLPHRVLYDVLTQIFHYQNNYLTSLNGWEYQPSLEELHLQVPSHVIGCAMSGTELRV